MNRLVRSVLLALILVVLSAAPGPVAAADSVSIDVRTAVDDAAPLLSAGLPVVRSSGGSSVSDRGVACSRPVVRVHPVLIAVMPPPVDRRRYSRRLCDWPGTADGGHPDVALTHRLVDVTRRASMSEPL